MLDRVLSAVRRSAVEGRPPSRARTALGVPRARRRPRARSSSPSPAGPTRPSSPGWPRDVLGPRTGAVRHRGVAVARPRGARRLRAPWPGSGGCAGASVATDELEDPAYVRQRPRPLLPLQGRADGRARAPRRRPRGRRSCSGSTSTTSATTVPASRPRPSAARVFPLVDAGFTKADVREVSRPLGLRTWDKPAAACLASRVPVRHAGHARHPRAGGRRPSRRCARLGFRAAAGPPLRRPGPRGARPPRTWAGRRHRRDEVVAAVRGAGYRYVTLDLEGFRSGNLDTATTLAAGRSDGHDRASASSSPSPRTWSASPFIAQLVTRATTSSRTSAGRASTSTRDGSSASSTASPADVDGRAGVAAGPRACGSTSSATSSRADTCVAQASDPERTWPRRAPSSPLRWRPPCPDGWCAAWARSSTPAARRPIP